LPPAFVAISTLAAIHEAVELQAFPSRDHNTLSTLFTGCKARAAGVGDSWFADVVPGVEPKCVVTYGEPLYVINHPADHLGTTRW